MRKLFILSILFLTFVACAQLQQMSDDPEEYASEKQRVMTKKVEKKDINLPEGSTILDQKSGFLLEKF